MITPVVALINESTVLKDGEVDGVVKALQLQVSSDFRRFWDADCRLVYVLKGQTLPPDWWQLVVLDDPDQAGDLGYHELSSQGTPLGKVFAKLDIDNGQSWTVTASHELLEMLADPYINWAAQGDDGKIYALECGDPVEADELGYRIYGTLVSDFITPSWYGPAENFPLDFMKHLKNRLELAPGGYISVYDQIQGWMQVNAQRTSKYAPVAIPKGSRRDRRSIPKAEWKRSER